MSKRQTVSKRIFSNVSFLAIGRAATAICSFAYIALAVRALGLRAFGLLILIHSLGTTASTLSRLQSWQTLIRYGSDPLEKHDGELLRKVVAFCIRLDILAAIATLGLGWIAVLIYSATAGWSPDVRFYGMLYVLICPFMYTGWTNGILRLTDRFHFVPINDALTALLRTFGCFIGWYAHLSLPYFVCVWAAAIFLDYTLYLFFALSTLSQRAELRLSLRDIFGNWRWELPGMWKFTRSNSVNQTLNSVMSAASTLIVGGLLGPAQAAIFRICRQIADGITTPAQLLAPVLFPELVRMRTRRDWAGLNRITWRIFAILCGIACVLFFISIAAGGWIFTLMLHIEVAKSQYYITVMLVAALLTLLITPLEPLLIVMGHVSYLMINRSIITVVYLILLVLFAHKWQLSGACYATALSSFAMLSTRIWRTLECSRTISKHPPERAQ